MSEEEERLRALVDRMPAPLRERYHYDAIVTSAVRAHALHGSSYETMIGDLACHLADSRERLERELLKLLREGMSPIVIVATEEQRAALAQRIESDGM